MKNKLLLGATASLVLVSSLFFSFKPVEKANNSVASLNGKELFAGIFFGNGQVAKLLPETQHIFGAVQKSKLQNNSEIVQSTILNELEKKDPNFMTDFKKDIESGDRLKIQQTLFETSKKVIDVLSENPTIKKIKNESIFANNKVGQNNGTTQDTACLIAMCNVVLDGSIAFGAVNVGQNTKTANYVHPTLIEESLINSIAKNLKN